MSKWKLVEYYDDGRHVADVFGDDGECKTACLNIADARLIVAAPGLYAEHQEWAEKFGAALMAVMNEDYDLITDLAMAMPFDFHESGAPTLRSAALAKARGEA